MASRLRKAHKSLLEVNPQSMISRFRGLRWLRGAALAICLLGAFFVAFASAANPIPQVVGPPVPQAVVPGSGQFTLTVYGANFVSGAMVNWNGQARSTTFISARQLQAQILASDVATATAGYITVTNPPPGGGVSSSSYGLVEVHTPTSTIVANRPDVYFGGGGSWFVLPTDFNNDGILDFAAEQGSEIITMLGNGDGTFRFGSVGTHNYYSPSSVANGDFNNDGNEDLAFGADRNGPPFQLEVSLGRGNGKFRFGSRFWQFNETYPVGITAGDFNRDGNLDLVTISRGLDVFLGSGDGTFKHSVDYPVGSFFLVSADFNGDGILDVALAWDHAVYIMLGNGDGSFQKPRTVFSSTKFLGSCSFGPSFFVTDFNGDGKADLAYCERDYPKNKGKIWVLLGNGDGTFKKPTSINVDPYAGAFSFAAGDFNSDGKTDLIANYFTSDNGRQSETDLFLGNGDGTFQLKKIINLPGQPYNAEKGIVHADFNSDGLLDFIFQQPGDISVFTQK
jgi:FG-GAP-like repeat